MTCTSANYSIMLYHEKRINPFKLIALHWHINKCYDCRELFFAMDGLDELGLTEINTANIPEDFTEQVMAKIKETPIDKVKRAGSLAYEDLGQKNLGQKDSGQGRRVTGLRLAGCLYALLLTIGTIMMHNIELGQIRWPDTTILQNIVPYTSDINILIFAVALVLTAIGIDIGKTGIISKEPQICQIGQEPQT